MYKRPGCPGATISVRASHPTLAVGGVGEGIEVVGLGAVAVGDLIAVTVGGGVEVGAAVTVGAEVGAADVAGTVDNVGVSQGAGIAVGVRVHAANARGRINRVVRVRRIEY